MTNIIKNDWKDLLDDEFNKKYFTNLYFEVQRSLVAHLVWDHGAGGSSPFTSTKKLGLIAQVVRAHA